MDQEIMNIIIKTLVAIISVLITSYVVPFLKSTLESTKYNDFLVLVEKCVEAANQIYTPEEWATKKQYVLGITENYCKEHNVPITSDELNAIIEGFVKAIKDGN